MRSSPLYWIAVMVIAAPLWITLTLAFYGTLFLIAFVEELFIPNPPEYPCDPS